MTEATSPRDDRIVELLTSVQQQLTRYVRTLVPNRSDAEEVLQETNLFIWRHSDQYALGTNFTAWACSIARYQVLTYRKRHARSRLCFSDALVEQLASSAVEVSPAARTTSRSSRGVWQSYRSKIGCWSICGMNRAPPCRVWRRRSGDRRRRSTTPWAHPRVAARVHAALAFGKAEGMMGSEGKLSELADLLARLCDSELDRHEWERLDALLCDDPEAQEFYRQFIALDVDLAWRGAARAACVPSEAAMREHLSGEVGLPSRSPPSSVAVAPLPSPLSPLPSLFGSPMFAYTVAALILAVGVVSARLWSPATASQLVVQDAVLPPVQDRYGLWAGDRRQDNGDEQLPMA